MLRQSLSILVIASFCVGTAAANVIYDQPAGPLGTRTSNSSGTSRNFDDFTLANSAQVTDVHWWGRSNSGGDNFTFTIYNNVPYTPAPGTGETDGKPGNAIFSTTGVLVTKESVNIGTSATPIYATYYSTDLVDPFDASPGIRYWLSIYNAAADADWGWQQANLAGNGAWLLQSPSNWLARGDRAFQLTGTVPEPGTLALLGLGLAGLAAAPRRKQ
jgi:hypothetical protein